MEDNQLRCKICGTIVYCDYDKIEIICPKCIEKEREKVEK